MWIATAERSQEIDRLAHSQYGLTSQRLMEAAGGEVFKALPPGHRIAILCGRGNNGGDGFAVAAIAGRLGRQVMCLVASSESELSPDAAKQLDQARRARVKPVFADDPKWEALLETLPEHDVIVDALLGTGARGALDGTYLRAVSAMNETDAPVVSIDIPTGIDADTGHAAGEAVWAQTTVTFGLPKRCFYTGEGPDHAGEVKVADIGFPRELLEEPTDSFLVDSAWVQERLPQRWHTSHKGTSGHVLVVAGSAQFRGAAALACMGALRAGAGLVTLASIQSVCDAVAAQLPEVTFLPLAEREGAISPDSDLTTALGRADAVVVGPGLTLRARGLLEKVLPTLAKPAVLDADALNLIAEGLELPQGPCLLTPHPGELGRLLGRPADELLQDRFVSVRKFGKKPVLMKGANSMVCEDPDGLVAVCPAGNPGMATGGMGDVLSGVIGTLMAQGVTPFEAGSCGATLHAMAGDICAEELGPIGYTASDLALALPKARAKISTT